MILPCFQPPVNLLHMYMRCVFHKCAQEYTFIGPSQLLVSSCRSILYRPVDIINHLKATTKMSHVIKMSMKRRWT